MIVKAHKTGDGRRIVAICDSDLIGKKFEDEKMQLDLSSGFYRGEEKSEKEAVQLIKGAYIVNIAGEECIKLAVRLGIANKGNIIKIKNIPHAQAILG